KQGVIDKAGRYVLQPAYDFISDYSEGRASVSDGSGYRLVDDAGRFVTPRDYDYIGSFSDGRAVFSQVDQSRVYRYGYLNRAGTPAITAQFAEAGEFANGTAIVKVKDGEFARIDTAGKQLAVYPYADVRQEGDGLLAFQPEKDGKYGYIDLQGK